MKMVKDLNQGRDFKGIKMRTRKGVIGYFDHQVNGIVFFSSKRQEDIEDGKLYPQIVKDEKTFLTWNVMDDEIPVNCHMKTKLADIDNT